MAVQPGHRRLGPASGRILLRTFRDGLAAQAGHDLTIEVARWSGELTLGGDLSPAGLTVTADLGSLSVLDGTGGVKPLTDRDRREIAVNARKTLSADRHPEASFTATEFAAGPDGGGTVTGTLTLAGTSRPLRLDVSPAGPDRYRVTATVVQSEYGIKPYRAFMGALRVRDAVDVEADMDLSEAGADPGEAGEREPLR
jgi:polyisoprenoid-binding protein YceI